jgi:hypothetical protein
MRDLNATHCDQQLTRGSLLAHSEPVTLVNPPDFEQPQAQDANSKLQDVTQAARPHLGNGKFQELEELLAEYEDISAVDREDHGRTKKVYHSIDTDTPTPVEDSPGKASGSKRVARRHATPRGYRGVRWPLIVSRLPRRNKNVEIRF